MRPYVLLTDFHDEYKVKKLLGQGSFARVYMARRKVNKRSFAIRAFTKEDLYE